MGMPMVVDRTRAQRGEEGDALFSAVVAVTAATGGMIALFDGVSGELAFTAIPTIVLLAAFVTRLGHLVAWAGIVTWALVLPMASGPAILAPASMIVVWVAFAVGPGRLLDWIHDDWIGGGRDPALDGGWIDDDRPSR